MAENHKQVQLSEDEKKQHDIQVKNCSVCVVAQDFQDCQHLVSMPQRVPLSYDKIKTSIAGLSCPSFVLQEFTEFGYLTKQASDFIFYFLP